MHTQVKSKEVKIVLCDFLGFFFISLIFLCSGQKTTFEGQFSPSTVCAPGIKRRSSGLEESDFTC